MDKESMRISNENNQYSLFLNGPIASGSDSFWKRERNRIQRAIENYFRSENSRAAKGGINLNRVHIEKHGKWHVISGTVDSHRTKIRYLSLVPKGSDGVQWIVDRLQVSGGSTFKG